MRKTTRRILRVPPLKRGGDKKGLVLVSGSFKRNKSPREISTAIVVSQLRLAEIAELQSRIAYHRAQLSTAWKAVRRDLAKGGRIERGPMRAWLESRVAVLSSDKKNYTRTRLIVR